MENSMVKISQNIKQTIAGILFVSGAITIPVAATASTAEALSEMITATPSARVVVTIEDGVATLSGIVPEASTRDSLLHAASADLAWQVQIFCLNLNHPASVTLTAPVTCGPPVLSVIQTRLATPALIMSRGILMASTTLMSLITLNTQMDLMTSAKIKLIRSNVTTRYQGGVVTTSFFTPENTKTNIFGKKYTNVSSRKY